MDLDRWLNAGLQAVAGWQDGFGAFDRHASLDIPDDRFAAVFAEFTGRLSRPRAQRIRSSRAYKARRPYLR